MKSAALRHPARLAGASLLRLQSDARLAELAIAGHEAAFDAIVDRYRTPLLRYCAGIVGPSRAEDAVQQTLINAHEAMTRTDEVRHLKPWLYRIAHNASLNVLRAVRDDVPLDEAALAGRAGGAGAGAEGPDESFARSEQFRATLAALQALPERQRAALVLRELEGRSHEEIAEALGVTKGSARQHLMRARVAVRSAVTAITPYPLVARLAELLSGGGSAGWVDAAAGAGASATLMKLGAGVAATGALVGGAVGTQHVIHGHGADAAPAVTERRAADAGDGARRATAAASTGTGTGTTAPAVVREVARRTADAGSSTGRRSSSPAKSERVAARKKRQVSFTPPTSAPATESHGGRQNASANPGHKDGGAVGGHRHGHGSDDQPKNASSGQTHRGNSDAHRGKTQHGNGGGKKTPTSSTTPSSKGGAGKGKEKDDGAADTHGSGQGNSGSKGPDTGSGSGSGSQNSASAPAQSTTSTSDSTSSPTPTTPASEPSSSSPSTTGD